MEIHTFMDKQRPWAEALKLQSKHIGVFCVLRLEVRHLW